MAVAAILNNTASIGAGVYYEHCDGIDIHNSKFITNYADIGGSGIASLISSEPARSDANWDDFYGAIDKLYDI